MLQPTSKTWLDNIETWLDSIEKMWLDSIENVIRQY